MRYGEKNRISATDVVLIVVIILMIASMLIKTFWLSPVQVSGDSMNDTIYNGEWLLVEKNKKPTYGDVIIVKTGTKTDGGDIFYIKRVIGLSGDTIYTLNGEVYRIKNGETEAEKLYEPYALYRPTRENQKKGTYDSNGKDIPKYVVGEDEVYFLGDNRCNSTDSRIIGTRNITDVYGVVSDWAIKNNSLYNWYYNLIYDLSGKIFKKG